MKLHHPTLQSRALACRGAFEGTAVRCGDREVSYPEFDALTDHVAALLAEKWGIGPGAVAAVRMARSEKLILAIFAVFKTGAALLPLAMDLPKRRLDDIQAMAALDIMITDEIMDALLKAPPCGAGLAAATPEDPALLAAATPEDPALLICTSGSSGRPKLVCHDQASQAFTCDLFPGDALRQGMPCRGIDTVVGKTSASYCAAFAFEFYPALLFGRTLALLTESEKNDDRAVGGAIERWPNCGVFFTPSELCSFLDEADFRRRMKRLAVLLVAGEMLQPAVRQRILREAAPETTLLMLYGATECPGITWSDLRAGETGQGVLSGEVRARIAEEETGRSVPGGEAGAGIAEEDAKPGSAGRVGEILVASPGLFRRYIGAEPREVTVGGRRFFRTGDLGELTPEGRLLIHGRMDRMVKYHGQRIELQDIEENILQYPPIRRTAVVVAKTERGTELLCAYFESEEEVDQAGLRAFLEERLPPYMIPPVAVRLPALPLSSHGKIDYQALRQRGIGAGRAETGAALGGPGGGDALAGEAEHAHRRDRPFVAEHKRSGAGEALLAALAALFGGPVAPEEDLFARGLDSLTAMKLVSRLGRAGWEVSASDILASRTAAGLAPRLKRSGRNGGRDGAPAAAEDGLFAITDAQFYWGADQDAFKKTHGLFVAENFLAERVYTKESLAERAAALMRRHPALRSRAVVENNRPGQRIAPSGQAITEWVDLRGLAGGTRERGDCPTNVGREDCPRGLTGDVSGTASPEPGIANEPRTGCSQTKSFSLSPAQQDRAQALSNAMLRRAMGSPTPVTLGILCARISDTACFFSLLTSHAASDGSSMAILKREICAPRLPSGTDAYVDYLRYISAREHFQAAAAYWKDRFQGVALSALPPPGGGKKAGGGAMPGGGGKPGGGAMPGDGGKPVPPDFRPLTLRLSADQTEALTRRCRAEGVSPVAWVLYAYGRALLKQFRVPRLVVQVMLSGRGLPVPGIEDVVGCLLMNVPVVISDQDTAAQFQRRYLEAERHGFFPGPLRWLIARGQSVPSAPGRSASSFLAGSVPSSLAPFLISEVFPPVEAACRCENLTRPDYERMNVSNFIVMDGGSLQVFLHYDAARTDGEFFTGVFEGMKEMLLT